MPKIQIRRGLYEDLKAIVLDIGEPCFIIDRGNNIVGNGVDNVETLLLNQPTLEDLNEKLNKTQITNCLLEVPQNIKLELKDSKLTLKAGSKVIIPNGVDVFKEVITTQDQSITYAWTPSGGRQCMVFVSSNGTLSTDYMIEIGACFSNSKTGSYTYYALYDTINNKVKMHNDTQLSLPIAIITQGSDGVTKSIDQIFNGMGYIGSTIWADKGVKGLIPNGRNEDGTLKNIEFVTSKVLTVSLPSSNIASAGLWVSDTYLNGFYVRYGNVGAEGYVTISEEKNLNLSSSNTQFFAVYAGDLGWNATGVTSFTPKLPFRAVDYNDKPEVSGWAMPSSKFIDLTLGASGTVYTAPANGWLCFAKQASATNQRIALFNAGSQPDTMIGYCIFSSSNTQGLHVFVPAKKGDKISVIYNAAGANIYFRFIYAKGEQ